MYRHGKTARSANPRKFAEAIRFELAICPARMNFQGVSMKLFVTFDAAPRRAAKMNTAAIYRAARTMRSLSLFVTIIFSFFALSGCNDYGNTFQVPTGVSTGFIAPSQANAGGAAFTLTVTASPLSS